MEGEKSKSCCPSTESCGMKGPANSKAFCKCGPGWQCEIRTIDPSECDGKPFSKCIGDCSCITKESDSKPSEKKGGEGSSKEQVVETEGAYCYCGEGFACTITKLEGPDAGKVFIECGNGCECQIPASGPRAVVLKDA